MEAENPALKLRPKEKREKPKGHGRNAAADFPKARRIPVPLEGVASGEGCPHCPNGKVYPQKEPSTLLRITGVAPFMATVYELERRRCNLCGEVFTAPAPTGVGEEKYDSSVAALLGLLRYGAGLPMNRIERLQTGMGIPLPVSTQWEILLKAAGLLAPAHAELTRQAAQPPTAPPSAVLPASPHRRHTAVRAAADSRSTCALALLPRRPVPYGASRTTCTRGR